MKVEIYLKSLMGKASMVTEEAPTIQFSADSKLLQIVKENFDDVTYYNMEYVEKVRFLKK